MADITLYPDHVINRKLSRMPGVQAAVKAKATEIHATAAGRLAPHRKTGNAHTELSRHRGDQFGRIDWFVSLVDPGGNAMAIEFGHNNSGRYAHVPGSVGGLRILTGSY